MQFRVRLDEILPTKTAARQLTKELARLESGAADQLVLTTHNVPRAVIISVDRYDDLLRAEAGDDTEQRLAA
jgi:PHD/YefM family antitoxin component YafN of YafNO toxin-antitoxin module